MRILVGVLYSGESQFNHQSHQDWEHFVIKHLPNREAHQTLYQTFNNRAEDFDLFVKIDADMEVCRADFFESLISYFVEHPQIDHISMKVDDFYTAKLIWGLNAYRSSIQFGENDQVYTDKAVEIPDHKRSLLKRHAALVPAAKHAYNPTDYQAFYFGCHKAVKVMARQSRSHMRNIRRLLLSAVLKRDKRHLIAYAGAATAFEITLQPSGLDQTSGEVKALFDQISANDHLYWIKHLHRHYTVVSQARKRFLT